MPFIFLGEILMNNNQGLMREPITQAPAYNPTQSQQPQNHTSMTVFGPGPFVVDMVKTTLNNDNFRTVVWTGANTQLTTMMLKPGEDIGLEVHPHTDQILFIEQGRGVCQMGTAENNLTLAQPIFADYAVFVPAGTWHNITNTGSVPLKLYTVYAPPAHAFGTVHPTKEVAEAEEHH